MSEATTRRHSRGYTPVAKRAPRLTPEKRKEKLDAAIVKALAKLGVNGMTRPAVAVFTKVSAGLVNRYYGSVDAMITAAVEMSPVEVQVKAVSDGFSLKSLKPSTRKAIAAYGK